MHRQHHDEPSGADKFHCSLKDISAEWLLALLVKGRSPWSPCGPATPEGRWSKVDAR